MAPTRPVEQTDGTPPKHNIPAQLTTLVGRDAEVVEVRRLLESHRLVTLTGAGGVGKTRIALSVASDMARADAYPDGVWLVELAGLRESALVPQAIARALKVQERSDLSLEEVLVDALCDRRLLLVLDNCEHLVDECARLVGRLLSSLRMLRVLATSREAFGIPGEVAWSVPSLGVPANGVSTLEALADCTSVQLLVERAGAAVRDFGLTTRNAAAVVTVCQRLDGIPLALELAAARLAVLTPEQLADRLGNLFPLLATGSRTADPRQQTLWATVDWSYRLLNEAEQTLFRRCGVFVGSWSLEQAETVCAGDPIDRSDVLGLIGQLVSKSLIVAEEHGAVARYRMLEPVRQFAVEQLIAHDDPKPLRDRQLAWLVEMSEHAEAELWGPDQLVWLERLEPERANFRSALEWSQQTGQVEAMLRLATSLTRFWDVHGYLTEGTGWLSIALEATTSLRTKARALALGRAAYLAVLRNDLATAERYLPEALGLAQEVDDDEAVGAAFLVMGMSARAHRDFQEAAANFERSLEMSRRANHRPGVYTSLYLLASAARFSNDLERARRLHEESLRLKHEHGDLWGIAASLFSLGSLERFVGDTQAAARLYRQSLTLRKQLRDLLGIRACLEVLAGLAADAQQGVALLGAAERLREAIGPGAHVTVATDQLARHLLEVLGDERFDACWSRGRELGLDQAIDLALSMELATAGTPASAPASQTPPDDRTTYDLVEDALRHLNDAPTLREHPLLRALPLLFPPGLPAAEAGTALRSELVQAIGRLRPDTPRPSTGAGAWLHYLVLHEAYELDRNNSQIIQRYMLGEGTFARARRRAISAVTQDLTERGRRTRNA